MKQKMEFYRWRPHPWHGLDIGIKPPERVNAYIEITPFDTVKYEIDKTTGYLRVDRPQGTSSLPPTLYGIIPRTYCADRVLELSPKAKRSDNDPLDICLVSERPINRSEVIAPARVIGGLQMIDQGEADDKIVAVLDGDPVWQRIKDLKDLPSAMVERLWHYFSTYKMRGKRKAKVTIRTMYGRKRALRVVEAAIEDYDHYFGLP